MARLGESRRGIEVVVGPESHDQHVRFVDAGVGGDSAGFRVDGSDRLLEDTHARLRNLAVGEPDGVE